MQFREIQYSDIGELFKVRISTRENCFTLKQLAELGITEESVSWMIRDSYKGWLCEIDGQVTGFAMGDYKTSEMWVIAVLPEYEGLGIGGRLLTLVEKWLGSMGCTDLWLTTDIDLSLRAYGFYCHQGWAKSVCRDGNLYMTKKV